MKMNFKKMFAIIWAIILVTYNALLFLIVSLVHKDFLTNNHFWLIYSCMMIAFLVQIFIVMFSKQTASGGLNFSIIIANLYWLIVFVVTTVMFCFVSKINNTIIFIAFILITSICAIFGIFFESNRRQINANTIGAEEVFKIEDLKDYLTKSNENYSEYAHKIIDDIILEVRDITSVETSEEIKSLDRRIIEYAKFIKNDALNGKDLDIEYNLNQLNKLLRERKALIAKLDNAENN